MGREAETRAASAEHRSDMVAGSTMADRAVAHAADQLGERQSVLSAAALQEEDGRLGLGQVGHDAIGAALDDAPKQDESKARRTEDRPLTDNCATQCRARH